MRKRVLLLNYSNSAIRGMTHEVREDVEGTNKVSGFGLFFGTRQTCLQWISDTNAECTNLAEWGAKLPAPQLFAEGQR
ncbi:hypothetical protein LB531_21500 [Mesorhizobium sp. CO1-1-2]|uniref:hypothetical protein n=1 Tax=Mesorhizobium sp. CO1-1-2 TaxID=2876635 RepID=UPI001CC9E96E|nr:hypothetical protein [Mesorhizobium sp. CO1-1-2]MBZ9683236.1 hypothetical protein [Mesorhizobium sp. CO1-1-2]